MISTTKPKRKPHRRGASKLLGPTGNSRGTAAAQRQCLACRNTHPKAQLLELGPERAEGPAPAAHRRHSYVCIARGCLELAARRLSAHSHDPQAARLAFMEPLVQLATTRLKEVAETQEEAEACGIQVLDGKVVMPGQQAQQEATPAPEPALAEAADGLQPASPAPQPEPQSPETATQTDSATMNS